MRCIVPLVYTAAAVIYPSRRPNYHLRVCLNHRMVSAYTEVLLIDILVNTEWECKIANTGTGHVPTTTEA